MTMPIMWLSPATGTPYWPTGRSGQFHRSELSCKRNFTLFVNLPQIVNIPQVRIVKQTILHTLCKTSADCEHQPGGSAVQGALRQPGRPRVELLPRLHQEEVDVDGRLFVNSRLKCKKSVPHCILLEPISE